MSKANKFALAAAKGLKKSWPKIAVIAGGVLLTIGGYLAGQEVPRYKKEIAEKEKAAGEKLKKTEKAKVMAKHFAAPVCAAAAGGMLLAASICENDRRTALGTTAVAALEATSKTLTDYTEATKEVVGDEKEKEIQEKVKKKRLEESPAVEELPTVQRPPSMQEMFWCYDLAFGGEPFLTTRYKLEKAENDIQARVLTGDEVTLNEAYEELGANLVKMGESYGWKYDPEHPSSGTVNFEISTTEKNGVPVFAILPNAVPIDKGFYEISNYGF